MATNPAAREEGQLATNPGAGPRLPRLAVKVAAAVAALAVVGWIAAGTPLGGGGANPGSARQFATSLAAVTQQTLSSQVLVDGVVGYGEPVPVSASGPGTITWAAPVGSTVHRGEALFEIDGRPVPLLYGSVPLYRPLGAWMGEQPDVRDAARGRPGGRA